MQLRPKCVIAPVSKPSLKASVTSTGVCRVTTADESLLQAAHLSHGQNYYITPLMSAFNDLCLLLQG